MEKQLSVLALELRSTESRELIVKLRVTNDYDSNLKILNSADVKIVKSVLEELGGKSEGLIKEGICLAIMREVLRRLPHKCVDCSQIVTFDPMAPVYSQCMACKTQLCTKCYQGEFNNVACGPCGSWIVDRFTIPMELQTKHYRKKIEDIPQEISVNKAEETIDSLNAKISATEKTKHRIDCELEDLQMEYERTHAAAIITEKRGSNFDKVVRCES